MSLVTCHMSISLDGFVAGPDQSLDHPLGLGGDRVHSGWSGRRSNPPGGATARDDLLKRRGAVIMGRNM